MYLFHSLLGLATLATSAPTLSTPSIAAADDFKFPAPVDKNFPSTSAISKRALGGVCLSNGTNFTGEVWCGTYPVNTCIYLGSYAGNILSFQPDEGTECEITQGRCNTTEEYTVQDYDSPHVGDLSFYSFYKELQSYQCYAQISSNATWTTA